MDASFAQSVIVWTALSIGLASVLYCVFSAASSLPPADGPEKPEQVGELEAPLDRENTA